MNRQNQITSAETLERTTLMQAHELIIDLLQAPFYFIAQYEAAQRVIAVPYDTFHALARKIEIDPKRILLFYSTGRCGSTLFSTNRAGPRHPRA